jgi:lipopolysaccharide biosynthesis protein
MLPSGFLLEDNLFSDQDKVTLVPSAAFERVHALSLTKYSSVSQHATNLDFAIHLHAHFGQEAIDILNTIADSCIGADLYITYNDYSVRQLILEYVSSCEAVSRYSSLQFVHLPNCGRNVVPLLKLIYELLQGYQVALHLHTKRSSHLDKANAWSKHMISCLAEDRDLVLATLTQFDKDPELGLVIPTAYKAIRPYLGWGGNFVLAKSLAERLSPPILIHESMPLVFPAGMMFWFRPAVYSNLSQTYLTFYGAKGEPLPQDGTDLHAIERLMAFVCESRGFKWAYLHPRHDGFGVSWRRAFSSLRVLEPCILLHKFLTYKRSIGKRHRVLNKLPARVLKKAQRAIRHLTS